MKRNKNIFLSIILLFIVFLFHCKRPSSEKDKFLIFLDSMEAYQESRDSVWDSGWESLSAISLQENLRQYQSWGNELSAIDASALSHDDQISYDLINYTIDNEIYFLENKIYENPLNSEGGFLTGIFYGIRDTNLDSDEKKKDYIKKLKALPQYLTDHVDMLKAGMSSGRLAPKLIVQNCINLLEPQITTSVDQSIYLIPTKELKDENYTNECIKAIQQNVMPALQDYHKFLVLNYLPNAPEDIGISNWPNGSQYYEQRIRYYTTLDISPEEVFEKGHSEVKRIRIEMEDIIEELEFNGSFENFINYLRTASRFYSKTPEDLLEKASRIAKKMEEQMPKLFGNLPRMPFTVVPVPAVLAPNYTGGRYSPGSYKNHRAGQYWVNTYKLENRPLYVLPALTLHEAVPGHHHQIMLAQEIKDLPKFRRNTYLSAFGEGWGLYSEFLGIEAGIYETPYENFGRLTYEMWRACRLVVDVGIHYKGWTRDEAIDFMASNTALSLHEVNTEIDRYIGWPGQAVSYKMGELKIKELRKKAEEALGDKFNIRDFHDQILKNGSILMSSLEKVIDNYIENTLSTELVD